MKIDWEAFDDELVGADDYLDLETGRFVASEHDTGAPTGGSPSGRGARAPEEVLREPARYRKVQLAAASAAWAEEPGPARMAWASGRTQTRRHWRCFARTVADQGLARQLAAALEDPAPGAGKRFLELVKSSAVEAARYGRDRTFRDRDVFWRWVSGLGLEVDRPAWLTELAAWRAETEPVWPAYVQELLARLDTALAREAPRVFARLRPGATESQLAETEAQLGFALPEELRTLYRWHEGSELVRGGRYAPQPMRGGYWLAPLASLAKHHAMCRDFAADGTFAKTGRGGLGWWDVGWLPFLQDQGGGTCCVDLTGTFTGHAGQLLVEYHGDTTRTVEYADVDAWIETFAAALEGGVIGWNAEYASVMPAHDFGPDLERWRLFHRHHNPGLPMTFTAT